MVMLMGKSCMVKIVYQRGGTSKGAYILDNELPKDKLKRDKVILSIYGSPDIRQIDGIGGADSLSSKVALIKRSTRIDADIEYTFGQVSIDKPFIDYNSNCGNILAGVGPFAVDEGLVPAVEPITKVRIYNTNTKKIIVAEVPVENGKFKSEGDFSIAGVPGTGAKIVLNFKDTAGSKTGKLLPTGNVTDWIELKNGKNLEVSIVDATAPAIFVRASDLGLTGKELPDQVNSNIELLELLEEIRGIVGEKIGLIENKEEITEKSPAIPKIVFLATSSNYVDVNGEEIMSEEISFIARTMSMQKMHKAFAVTGGICTSAAAIIPGTIVNQLANSKTITGNVRIGHPSGTMEFNVKMENKEGEFHLENVSIARTARRIMEGFVHVPSSLM